MVNHLDEAIFGRICVFFFSSIKQANPSKVGNYFLFFFDFEAILSSACGRWSPQAFLKHPKNYWP